MLRSGASLHPSLRGRTSHHLAKQGFVVRQIVGRSRIVYGFDPMVWESEMNVTLGRFVRMLRRVECSLTAIDDD